MISYLVDFITSNLLYFALHIESNNSFKKPLSANKEKEYFELMSKGDENARNKIIEHNLRLVAHIIKKYYSSTNDQDDLISIGTIGLIKAVSTFSYDKGTRLATYASRCIENEILMHFRNLKKTAQDVFISDPIDVDKEGNSISLLDIVAEDDCILDNILLKMKSETLHKLIIEHLTPREKLVIKLRYGLNDKKPLTQREVAEKLNISRSYVSRIEKKAILNLRKKFDKLDKVKN